MAEQSLKDKTVKGTFWSAADTLLGQGVTFVVGLVLARILSPEEYGLIGIVTIFTTVMMGIVDSGFGNALIRKTDVSNEDYSTLFVFNMGASIFLFIVLYFCAPWIALFFERPQLIDLIRVMGILLIFQALSIVQNTILTQRIDFKTKTKASLISAVISGVIGISMAFIGCGVWSLVGQQLSRQLLYSICLWLYNKWWPTIKISVNSFRYMWGFGWKLLVSGLLDNIWKQLYQVVVGKFYSPAALGQYTRSEQYASMVASNLSTIVQRVSYPVLSQVQDDKVRLVGAFRRIIKITMFVTVIMMISMGAVAEPLIYCLIGPQWHEAAIYLPLICLNMSLYPLHVINLNLLQVQGRTDIFLYLEIVKKVIAIIPICIGIFVSIYWMLIAGVFVGIISFFLNSHYSGKSINYSSWMQLKDVIPSFAVSFAIALSVYYVKFLPLSYWLVLPIQIIVGIIVFVTLCKLAKIPEYYEILDIVRSYMTSFRKKRDYPNFNNIKI